MITPPPQATRSHGSPSAVPRPPQRGPAGQPLPPCRRSCLRRGRCDCGRRRAERSDRGPRRAGTGPDQSRPGGGAAAHPPARTTCPKKLSVPCPQRAAGLARKARRELQSTGFPASRLALAALWSVFRVGRGARLGLGRRRVGGRWEPLRPCPHVVRWPAALSRRNCPAISGQDAQMGRWRNVSKGNS